MNVEVYGTNRAHGRRVVQYRGQAVELEGICDLRELGCPPAIARRVEERACEKQLRAEFRAKAQRRLEAAMSGDLQARADVLGEEIDDEELEPTEEEKSLLRALRAAKLHVGVVS